MILKRIGIIIIISPTNLNNYSTTSGSDFYNVDHRSQTLNRMNA